MKSKKGDMGWETIVMWTIVIGIGVVLMVIMVKSRGVGNSAWASIKDMLSFG